MEEPDDVSLRCLLARMAADGSWGYESVLAVPLTQEARTRIVTQILASRRCLMVAAEPLAELGDLDRRIQAAMAL